MPTTRAARAAAARAARCLTSVLPADVLGLVLYQLPLAHDIALAGLTCRALRDAAKLALKLRPYSGEVVTLAGHTTGHLYSVVALGPTVTSSPAPLTRPSRSGATACVRTIQAHDQFIWSVARCRTGASSPAPSTAPRSCGNPTARSSAPSRSGKSYCASQRCPTACTLRSAWLQNGETWRGPAVPRRRHARPHLQGALRRGVGGSGDARRPAHHQRLGGRFRQGVERRQQEPCEHLRRAHSQRILTR